MSWKKAKAAIHKKPCLIDPYRRRNIVDASAMLANELPAPEKVFELARLRMGFDAKQWEEYLGMPSKRLKRKCRSATPIRFGGAFSLSRRAVVALAILLAVTTFMACTPIGRGWAVAAYNAVSEVIDGILYIRSEDKPIDEVTPEIEVYGVESTAEKFDSLEDMLDKVDKPVFYLCDDDIVSASFQMTSSTVYGEYLESEYEFGDGVRVCLRQDWNEIIEERIGVDDSKKRVVVKTDSGVSAEGVYSYFDASFVGMTSAKDVMGRIVITKAEETNIAHILQALYLK